MKLSKYLRSITRENDIVLYHSLFGRLCAVDNTIWRILQEINQRSLDEVYKSNDSNFHSEIDEIVEEFTRRRFIVNDNDTSEREYWEKSDAERFKNSLKGTQLSFVQLITSNACNFNCNYCFVTNISNINDRHVGASTLNMALADAISYVRKAIKVVKSNENSYLHIQFFGGEPLMNSETIKGILNFFENGEKLGMKITYSIITNGSLITREIAEYFLKYSVSVVVSFDGPTGSDRRLRSGKPAINDILRGLDTLNKSGVDLSFNSVLSSETFHYFGEELVDCAMCYGVNAVGVLLDLNTDFYMKAGINRISDKLLGVYKYAKEKDVQITGYWVSMYESLFKDSEYKKGFKTCSATGSQISIEPSGKLFTCKASNGSIGHIDSLNDALMSHGYLKYSKRSIINSSDCYNCDLEGVCSGMCPGSLEKKYDSISKMEKSYCNLMKILVKELIMLEDEKSIETYSVDI